MPRSAWNFPRRFDRIFGEGEPPTPYIAAWHQAPFGHLDEFEGVTRDDFALHLELFTIRRTSGKLKFLAGSESGMNVFINDVPRSARPSDCER
ncbi:galactose-1-phosphate uridylyltransferase [Streptomyces violaceorubidus]